MLDPLGPESRAGDEERNVSRQDQACEHSAMERLPPSLPSPDANIRRCTVFQKQQRTTRLQYSRDATHRFLHRHNRTERERAHDSVDAGVFKWYPLSRQ